MNVEEYEYCQMILQNMYINSDDILVYSISKRNKLYNKQILDILVSVEILEELDNSDYFMFYKVNENNIPKPTIL